MRVLDAEISRIAAYLGMDEAEFIANETELAPDRKGLMLKSRADGACVYLDENNLCRLNPVKPDKCRSFPFAWTNPDFNAVCPELASACGSLDRINRIDRIRFECYGRNIKK